jgi:hypothetical protein
MIKSRRMRRKIRVDHTGDVINTFKTVVGKCGKVEEHLVDLGVKVRITLRLVVKI